MSILNIATPKWLVPILKSKARFKGIKGGRNCGKSFEVVDMAIERMVMNPFTDVVCIREIQKSIRFSVKKLIAERISHYNLGHMFDVQNDCIYRIHNGKRTGIIIFIGLQDHTADSIKSLQGFDIAIIEEAQSISSRSMKLLTPTIRKEGSELWFVWNPYLATDAVDVLFKDLEGRVDENGNPESILVHVNYYDNPYLTDAMNAEAERFRETNPEEFANIWLGQHLTRTDDQVFGKKWEVGEREINFKTWQGPYHGLDFGFAKDPTVAVKVWITDKNELYIESECGKVGLELDDTPIFLMSKIEGIEEYVIRADSARPESISYLKRNGLRRIEGVSKWPGSVKDGIEHMKSYSKIVVHPDCKETTSEMVNYKYKVDKRSGDIMPDIVDKDNHFIDAIRYAICPLIKGNEAVTDYGSLM